MLYENKLLHCTLLINLIHSLVYSSAIKNYNIFFIIPFPRSIHPLDWGYLGLLQITVVCWLHFSTIVSKNWWTYSTYKYSYLVSLKHIAKCTLLLNSFPLSDCIILGAPKMQDKSFHIVDSFISTCPFLCPNYRKFTEMIFVMTNPLIFSIRTTPYINQIYLYAYIQSSVKRVLCLCPHR